MWGGRRGWHYSWLCDVPTGLSVSKCSSKRDKKVRGKFEEVPCFRNARRDLVLGSWNLDARWGQREGWVGWILGWLEARLGRDRFVWYYVVLRPVWKRRKLMFELLSGQ